MKASIAVRNGLTRPPLPSRRATQRGFFIFGDGVYSMLATGTGQNNRPSIAASLQIAARKWRTCRFSFSRCLSS